MTVLPRTELAEAARWAANLAAPHGAVRIAAPRVLPWSTLVPLRAGHVTFWLKIGPQVQREIEVLTRHLIYPTAAVASVAGYRSDMGWLLLHHIPGTPVGPDFPGPRVACALARMRNTVDAVSLSADLPRLTVGMLIAELSNSFASGWWDKESAHHLSRTLVRHRDQFDRLESRLGDDPQGLVHGDLHPANILRDGDGIVLLDWMDCAVGSALWDDSMLYVNFANSACPAGLTSFDAAILAGLKSLNDLVSSRLPDKTAPLSISTQRLRRHAQMLASRLATALRASEIDPARLASSTQGERT
jgi:hypothetical protein